MKYKLSPLLLSLVGVTVATGQSLYHRGSDAVDSMPLTFTVGSQLTYDDNVTPGSGANDEESLAFNPYVGASFISISPQTTCDVYVKLGLVYLFDAPPNIDEVTSQSRAGINYTYRASERLRFTSSNLIAYELEPDLAQGMSANRALGAFFSWSTDNSVGYKWSERFGSYSGLAVNGVDYDVENNDRLTWEIYNQLRYQLTPQTVLTGEYRYSQTTGDGLAEDSTNQFFLIGAEHRLSPRMIGVGRVGYQLRDVNNGSNVGSPYLELALNAAVNKSFNFRSFMRYGIESGDTVRAVPGVIPGPPPVNVINTAEFDERKTLRLGINGDYAISPTFKITSGVDYIPTSFGGGRSVTNLAYTGGDLNEDIFNAYSTLSVKINPVLTASVSYNYTHSSSDFPSQTFDRNRISVGLNAQF